MKTFDESNQNGFDIISEIAKLNSGDIARVLLDDHDTIYIPQEVAESILLIHDALLIHNKKIMVRMSVLNLLNVYEKALADKILTYKVTSK